ncbi:hypothetical protein GCM10011348_39900 [Marinobacterium nitratireducens]|uniref:Uncharacterized protein n=1 Tax=Marinobacterium nitratireducens TaxID=518897 RepID=A0A917ZMI1_9GAMM|nr:hypothetical protein [Marinobacterium nitratireducens]GGO87220.1 hypothetical protein GCM10011348_39900 [Marinobacterium nitratireducens]
MDPKRRFLLKGMLASGAGGALLGSAGLAQAALGANRTGRVPTLLLSGSTEIENSFGAGVRAALPPGADFRPLRAGHVDAFAEACRSLSGNRPLRLIGMLDDASGELLIARARHAGARVSWLGLHAVDNRQTRHQIVNAPGTRTAVLALGEQLGTSAAGFALKSEQPFSEGRDLSLAGRRAGATTSDWATHLGHALAEPGRPVDSAALAARSARLEGRFVSFVIEV